MSLDYNSSSWSLYSFPASLPFIFDCPQIPLKESKQKRLDCDRCLDDTVSARYRGVWSGATYQALYSAQCLEKRSTEMWLLRLECWYANSAAFHYRFGYILGCETNRSVCLGRGAPGGVLHKKCRVKTMPPGSSAKYDDAPSLWLKKCLYTWQQGNQGKMPDGLEEAHFGGTFCAQDTEHTRKRSQELNIQGTKMVSFFCQCWVLKFTSLDSKSSDVFHCLHFLRLLWTWQLFWTLNSLSPLVSPWWETKAMNKWKQTKVVSSVGL